MSSGYINLPRSLLNDPIWKSLPYTYRHIFITILQNVVYQEIDVDDFGKIIHLMPGEMLTTYRRMVELCNEDDIDKRTIERAFVKFKLCGFSGQRTGHRKTIVTITRTDVLELIGTKIGTNSGQTRDINKEDKEVNKSRKQQQKKKAIASAAVSFYKSLIEDTRLNDDEREILSQYPEDKVERAIAYSKSHKATKTLIAQLRWYCNLKKEPQEIKKIDLRKWIREEYQHGEVYNGATCWHGENAIAFERGMTSWFLSDKEANYEENMYKMFEKIGIHVQGIAK